MLFPRVYTWSEAEALVPLLAEQFQQISALMQQAKAVHASSLQALSNLGAPSPDLDPAKAAEVVERHKRELTSIEAQIAAAVQGVMRLGVTVQSLEPGQVQAWAIRGGFPVRLIWRSGESSFGHWHDPSLANVVHDVDDPTAFGVGLPN